MTVDERERLFAGAGATMAALTFAAMVALAAAPIQVPMLNPTLPDPRDGEPLPAVVVCAGAPVTGADVGREIAWWAGVGYDIRPLRTAPCRDTCDFDGRRVACLRGHISIGLQDGGFNPDHAGETLSGPHARVILLPAVQSPRERALSLRHEIGHAINFGHARTLGVGEPNGHVMSSRLDEMGDGKQGLYRRTPE